MSSPVADETGPFIDGAYRSGADLFDVEDPSTEETIASVAIADGDDVDHAIEAARDAQREWARLDASERGRVLRQVGDRLRDRIDELAEIETREMGRPIGQSTGIVTDGIGYFEYYAGLCDKIQGETIPVDGNRLDYTRREPLGVSAQIIPWNAAVMLGIRGIVPALAAGNAVVAKPSSEAPLSVLKFAELATEAGLPDGLFNVVPGPGSQTGATLTEDPRINEITFTGSVTGGTMVGKAAVENVVPVSLELGGKSPSIVFEDADLESAIEDTLKVFFNSGQVCFATTRVFVHEEVYDEFTSRLAEATESMSIGPGIDGHDIGPVISEDALEDIERYVDGAVDGGARALTGGSVVDRDGHYFEPTIVADADDDAPISCDEVFGPVITVYEFSDEAEVVHRANDTEYGLYSAVWTNTLDRAHRVANELEAGTVAINEFPATFPQAPFGGYKKSGLGREKGMQAIDHYTQLKNVVVSLGQSAGTVFDK
ncbi:aldehyde dehydrogenase family protein [Natrarchaeobius oligotrophus]|uniref:Aldehyde dehydrogenase n=1 Tax=Natrarchaeobius chitinivorans TaxID=1679083 RepID=A0A3N6NR23_NATCH|nr:aldehyde dehydrogenase family protein [Natrarchaeobius chitinivorans]RQH02373.1 aldehyde dehydrogenase [Natrarchaeobius chitinivorans]